MDWNYYRSSFEYEKTFPDFAWSWAGHKYFVYDLIRNLKPQTIVELGTHRGTSFFSMCQAVKDGHLDTNLYAVDTWQGEKHSGLYDESILKEVKKIKRKFYSLLNANLLRTTFDDAKKKFANDVIDLLHIDGLHTYEAVKHDFDNWLDRVKKNGIIILHDINERKKDFGVYRLWEEIKKRYTTIEFDHSHGLGVILLNPDHKVLTEYQDHWKVYYPARYLEDLGPFAEMLQIQLNEQTAIGNEYDRQLTIIKSAKFYKLWQNYCLIKKSLFKKA